MPTPQWTPAHQERANALLATFDARKAATLAQPEGEVAWRTLVVQQARYYITKFEHADEEMLRELVNPPAEEMDELEDMVRFFVAIEGTGMGAVYEQVRDGVLPIHELPLTTPHADPTT